MEHNFKLYWRRETGCDAGTPVSVKDLDPAIRSRVIALADEALLSNAPPSGGALLCDASPALGPPIEIRLPFLDRREWRRRSESLRGIALVREGRVIRYVPQDASSALRDLAADTVGGHPAWLAAPGERDPGYFRTWREVSVALQEFLRRTLAEIHFRDAAAFEDRGAAWPLLVYRALRPCRGMAAMEFTYDVADPEMLSEALRMIRRPLQEILGGVQHRLAESGRVELSRRYAPVWYEDIVRAVQAKPRRLLAVLGDEALLVDAVITLGTGRDLGVVKPFVRRVMTTLRSFYDRDLRGLAPVLVEQATRALEAAPETPSRELLSNRFLSQRLLSKERPQVISSLAPAARDRRFAAANTSGHYRPGSAISR